jgi:hypothetical protein
MLIGGDIVGECIYAKSWCWIMLLNHYMRMTLIVDGEFIHASFDVIGDECVYIHITVDYSRWL